MILLEKDIGLNGSQVQSLVWNSACALKLDVPFESCRLDNLTTREVVRLFAGMGFGLGLSRNLNFHGPECFRPYKMPRMACRLFESSAKKFRLAVPDNRP